VDVVDLIAIEGGDPAIRHALHEGIEPAVVTASMAICSAARVGAAIGLVPV
jgi:hypothetical protein